MNKFKKNNLFIEINNDEFLIAVGKYDDELNFKIIEKEIVPQLVYENQKMPLNHGRIKKQGFSLINQPISNKCKDFKSFLKH